MFQAACQCVVGQGDRINFWLDRWIEGRSPAQIAPALMEFLKGRGAKHRKVAEDLHDHCWVSDIRGSLSVPAIIEFISLWTSIQNHTPLFTEDDAFIWCLSANGRHSAASAYRAFFFWGQFKLTMPGRYGGTGLLWRRSYFAGLLFAVVAGMQTFERMASTLDQVLHRAADDLTLWKVARLTVGQREEYSLRFLFSVLMALPCCNINSFS